MHLFSIAYAAVVGFCCAKAVIGTSAITNGCFHRSRALVHALGCVIGVMAQGLVAACVMAVVLSFVTPNQTIGVIAFVIGLGVYIGMNHFGLFAPPTGQFIHTPQYRDYFSILYDGARSSLKRPVALIMTACVMCDPAMMLVTPLITYFILLLLVVAGVGAFYLWRLRAIINAPAQNDLNTGLVNMTWLPKPHVKEQPRRTKPERISDNEIDDYVTRFMEQNVQPCIRITKQAEYAHNGGSYFGGAPKLAADLSWPVDRFGYAQLFIAQIALSEIPNSNHLLPAKGTLYFFICSEALEGDAEQATVLFSEQEIGEHDSPPPDTAAPENIDTSMLQKGQLGLDFYLPGKTEPSLLLPKFPMSFEQAESARLPSYRESAQLGPHYDKLEAKIAGINKPQRHDITIEQFNFLKIGSSEIGNWHHSPHGWPWVWGVVGATTKSLNSATINFHRKNASFAEKFDSDKKYWAAQAEKHSPFTAISEKEALEFGQWLVGAYIGEGNPERHSDEVIIQRRQQYLQSTYELYSPTLAYLPNLLDPSNGSSSLIPVAVKKLYQDWLNGKSQHQILGYPKTYDTPFKGDDILLLQVDSDRLNNWGDCGSLVFWIDAEHLAKRDFDQANGTVIGL